jgi:hypothetical protein
MISTLLSAKNKVETKTGREYHPLAEYNVLQISTSRKLIKTRETRRCKYVFAAEDLYDLIEEAHTNVGYGGKNRTYQEVNLKYYNITNVQYYSIQKILQTMHRLTKEKGYKRAVMSIIFFIYIFTPNYLSKYK